MQQRSGSLSLLSNAVQAGQSSDPMQDDPAKTEPGTPKGYDGSKNSSPASVPSWIHEKTKAGKDRKRLPLACQSCRKKKVKCSGERPSCDQCLKHNIPCIYKSNSTKRSHSRHEEIHHQQQLHLNHQYQHQHKNVAANSIDNLSRQYSQPNHINTHDSVNSPPSYGIMASATNQPLSHPTIVPSSNSSSLLNSTNNISHNPQVSLMSASLSKNLVLDPASPKSVSPDLVYVSSDNPPVSTAASAYSSSLPISDVTRALPLAPASNSQHPSLSSQPVSVPSNTINIPTDSLSIVSNPSQTPAKFDSNRISQVPNSDYSIYSNFNNFPIANHAPSFPQSSVKKLDSSFSPTSLPTFTTNSASSGLSTSYTNNNDTTSDNNSLQAVPRLDPVPSLTLSSTPVAELPPLELRIHLAEVFFHCCHGQSYNLFHRPTFFESLNNNTVPLVVVYAVCAVSARFSSRMHDRFSPPYMAGEQYAREARRLALDNFDRPDLSLVAALLLLSLHDSGTCETGKSWMYGGMALRMAAALQLNCEQGSNPLDLDNIDSGPRISFLERELRRRTFWSCFLMDRYASSHEHLQFLDENDIGIQLPVHELLFTKQIAGVTQTLDGRILEGVPSIVIPADTTENMGVAAYTVKIIALWGRAVKYLKQDGKRRDPYPYWHRNSDFSHISEALYAWADGLPQRLKYSAVGLENHLSIQQGAQYAFLHLAYHHTLMWLFRSIGETENNQLSKISSSVSLAGNTVSFSPVSHTPINVTNGESQNNSNNDPSANGAARRLHKAAREICLRCANAISMIVDDCRKHNVILTSPFIASGVYTAFCVQAEAAFGSNVLAASTARHNLEIDLRLMLEMKNYWGSISALCDKMSEIWADWVQRTSSGIQEEDTIPNEMIDEERMLDLEKHFMYITESPIVPNQAAQKSYSPDLMSYFGFAKNSDLQQWNGLWPSDDLRNYQESTIDSLVAYATGNPGWNISFAG